MKKGSRNPTKKPKKSKGALLGTRNVRLTAQTRKLLGKHYASKYRVR